MGTKTFTIKTDVKNITVTTEFKKLSNTDSTFKSVIGVFNVGIEDKNQEVDVYWDTFESSYSLSGSGNNSYDRLQDTLLSCFSLEQLTDADGNYNELYHELVDNHMEQISDFVCEYAEAKIYEEF